MSDEKKGLKFFIFLFVIFFCVYIYLYRHEFYPLFLTLVSHFESFISNYPFLNGIYMHFKNVFSTVTYLGVFYVMFFSSFFFVPVPLDGFFIGYLMSSLNPILLILICTVASTIGLFMNYFFGLIFGEKLLKKIFKDDLFDKFSGWINKFGSFLLVFSIFLPILPSQLLSVLYGFSKYDVKKFLIISLISIFVKFILLYVLFIYAKDQILFFINM